MPSPAAAFPAARGVPAPGADPRLDAARERVVALLTDRYADDSLTIEQFEAALDRMHGLGSVAALDAMAGELAAGAAPTRPVWAPAVPTVAAPAAAASGIAPLQAARRGVGRVMGMLPEGVRAVMSTTRRAGPWVVPPRLHLTSVMSNVELDLREAVLPAECEIHVFALMGNVKLWLPPGAEAVMDVEAFMSSLDDRARPGRGGGLLPPRRALLRVTGTAIMGEVKVRREDW